MVESPRLTLRKTDDLAAQRLEASGYHPLLSRLWAARGVTRAEDVRLGWPAMLPPAGLTQSEHAACLLADAIRDGKRMLIVADYDCDGATACAVGLRALGAMGAIVDFLVPNRFETGYGLSPAVVDLACQHASGRPDLLITVDNGIASVDGHSFHSVTTLIAYLQLGKGKPIDMVVVRNGAEIAMTATPAKQSSPRIGSK